jgi:hypothetical protein
MAYSHLSYQYKDSVNMIISYLKIYNLKLTKKLTKNKLLLFFITHS